MASRPLLVAVLDDESDFRRALARLLKSHGHDAVGFATGRSLLAAATDTRFDCVLLDLHMPGLTGIEVLEALRVGTGAPPVIIVTGHDDPESMRRALELDAFTFHRKSVRASDLIGAIERACSS